MMGEKDILYQKVVYYQISLKSHSEEELSRKRALIDQTICTAH